MRAKQDAKPQFWPSIALTSLGLGLVGCAIETGDGGEIGQREQGIQKAFVDWGYGNDGVSLANFVASNWIGHAVGAIRPRHNYWAGSTSEGGCGATFISPTYAVTVAHCVDKHMVPRTKGMGSPTKFKLQHVQLHNLSNTRYQQQSEIRPATGYNGWPAYMQLQDIGSSDGYYMTEFTDCVVARRCSNEYGNDDCTADTSVQLDVDIALIQCPSRANSPFYATAYATTYYEGTGAVESNFTNGHNDQLQNIWYHEVVNAWSEDGGSTAYGNKDHYWKYVGNTTDNYHYYSPHETLEYFPLITKHRNGNSSDHYESSAYGTRIVWEWNGSQYVQTVQSDGRYVVTNLPACHGTSGSGVFRRVASQNKWYFVGPMVHGSTVMDRLCDDFTGTSTKSEYVRDTYSAMWVTNQFAPEVYAELH